MRSRFLGVPRSVWTIGIVILLSAAAWATRSIWLPPAQRWWNTESAAEADAGHSADDAGHAAHGPAAESITLSDQAKRSIGLKTGQVSLGPYDRAVSVPAIVTERPGRTDLVVAAPLTGFIDDVYAVPGQAVKPGDPLFVLRLTNEDVVQAQTDYLKTIEAIDVEDQEIKRLQSIASGVIAEKVVLERKYERQKLAGLLKAQREALLLHGMSDEQADSIARDRRLLREFLITTPVPHDESDADHLRREHPDLVTGKPVTETPAAPDAEAHLLVVRQLPVRKGEAVTAGDTLAVLSDLEHLYLEGRAFEGDAAALNTAAKEGWSVTAVPQQGSVDLPPVAGLEIAYVANDVDPQSRALRFYVALPNETVNISKASNGRAFPTWRYKPGQRMDVRIPVERWEDAIVVPVAAVAQDGLESYVFVQNGRRFQRRAVNVTFRDRESAVIANDGTLYPGETIAMNSAHQLQLAIKNQAGGAPDPHAGHTH